MLEVGVRNSASLGHVVRSLWKQAGLAGICKAVDDGLLTGLKIVSGGQTGADRAALDWPIELGVLPKKGGRK